MIWSGIWTLIFSMIFLDDTSIVLCTTKDECNVAIMASYVAGWRISLKSRLSRIWIWHGYVTMKMSAIWLKDNPIYIAKTELSSYIGTMLLYKTSLGLWLEPPWEGGWMWYSFMICIYDCLCFNMVFDLWTWGCCYCNMVIKLIPYMSMMREFLIEDTEPTLPPCLSSYGEELW